MPCLTPSSQTFAQHCSRSQAEGYRRLVWGNRVRRAQKDVSNSDTYQSLGEWGHKQPSEVVAQGKEGTTTVGRVLTTTHWNFMVHVVSQQAVCRGHTLQAPIIWV